MVNAFDTEECTFRKRLPDTFLGEYCIALTLKANGVCRQQFLAKPTNYGIISPAIFLLSSTKLLFITLLSGNLHLSFLSQALPIGFTNYNTINYRR